MKIPELLAPAGNYETLVAVCNAGADAVYAAGTKYGARAYADNFSEDELISAISYVHLHGKKLYLTLNTLIKNSEFDDLYDYILPLYNHGLDAVIVQDLGVIDYLRRQFPLLPVHVSTQANICGSDAVNFFNKLGCERVVLARELSLNEIKNIKNNSDAELEIFVHGALCYCYSGMCFYSSLIGGRSGNRGRCAQPCRMSYSINNQEAEYMSLKDLSTLEVLDKLCNVGVDSLKIEGRMKSKEYAAGVTAIYRKYLDILKENPENYKVSDVDIDKLYRLYQRRGFSNGYLFKHNGPGMIISDKERKYDDSDIFFDNLQKKVKVKMSAYFSEGNESILVLQDINDNYITVTGEICQTALNKTLDETTVKDKLSRVNDTPLEISSMDIEINGNIFMPLSALNNLRRDAVKTYLQFIDDKYKRETPERINTHDDVLYSDTTRYFSASFLTLEQGMAISNCEKISQVYFPFDLIFSKYDESLNLIETFRNNYKKVYLALPEIFRLRTRAAFDLKFDELNTLFDGYLIKNIDELEYIYSKQVEKDCIIDFTVYSFNNWSADLLKKYYSKLTAPIEFNYHELKNMNFSNGEMLIYGRYPMMFTANCLKKNSDKCTANSDSLYYKDRKGMRFYVKTFCSSCYNIIFNANRTSLIGVSDKTENLNISGFRYSFTDEKTSEVISVLNNNTDPENFTRGHFIRGVE